LRIRALHDDTKRRRVQAPVNATKDVPDETAERPRYASAAFRCEGTQLMLADRAETRYKLAAAFRDHRHLRCPNVLCQDDGQRLTRQMVQYRVLRASRRAKLSQDGVHILRHTFCSHLAMRGAPPRAIQELAGHRELGMTHFCSFRLSRVARDC
jgi:integrase